MRKIGIALITLLATSACAESPTAGAVDAEEAAALGASIAPSDGYEEEEFTGSGDEVAGTTGDTFTTTMELERGPGLAGSGH